MALTSCFVLPPLRQAGTDPPAPLGRTSRRQPDKDPMPDFQQLMQEATRLTRAGDLQGATDLIQAALRGQGAPAQAAANDDAVIDVEAREVPDTAAPALPSSLPPGTPEPRQAQPQARQAPPVAEPARPAARPQPASGAQPGSFVSGRHGGAGAAGRDYKLYLPPQAGAQPLPLVVMLHGCTQDADDFAAGTRMNEVAREQGFYVLYPVQSQQANPQKCWNWFKHSHQKRERGEPAILAGMVRALMAQHGIDPRRVYVAGLSAGGAMAAILGQTHPELFAAVGVHSGLAAGSATDLPSALQAMKQGAASVPRTAGSVPTIVFHGTGDHTVHPLNGEQVFGAAVAGPVQAEPVQSPGSRRVTRKVSRAASGESFAEHWVVDGAPHAWSGGSSAGSYTDMRGPDATAEMVRFFLEHPKAG
jgi:poly(hydroxyalkanoate) depolymerase family esterase